MQSFCQFSYNLAQRIKLVFYITYSAVSLRMATACYPLLVLYSELLLFFYIIMYDPELDRGLFHTTLMNTTDDNNSHKCDLSGTVSNFM